MEATTAADYLYETTTIAPTTFDLQTTTATYSSAAAAAASLLDLSDSSITPTKIVARLLHASEQSLAQQQQQQLEEQQQQQQQHNQITFEIPSHHDLEHINTLHTFNTLLKRIGNVAYDTITSRTAAVGELGQLGERNSHTHLSLPPLGVDATGQHITSEQISKSAVLNLADLKGGSGAGGGNSFLEELFGDADMHMVINYLWIGVVTALVVLSVIFILFSCYFYRKFRQWKKCNKDIRNHLHNELYTDGHIVACDRLIDAHGQQTATAGLSAAAAYYQQIESPPCYTIATGLPTYDEALHHHHGHHGHHQQQQNHQHFAYGMKFMYPTIAGIYNNNCMLKQQHSEQWQQQQQQQQQQQEQQLMKQKSYKKVSPAAEGAAREAVTIDVDEMAEGYLPTTTYECDDIAELHSINYPAAAMGVAAPLLGVNASVSASAVGGGGDGGAEKSLLEEVITIRLDDMTPEIALAAAQQQQMTAAATATRRNSPTLLYFNEQQRLWQQQQTTASDTTEQQQQQLQQKRSSATTIA